MTAPPPLMLSGFANTPAHQDADALLLALRQQIDLDQLDPDTPDLFPGLIAALSDTRPAMRMSLIELLAEIGEAATPWLCTALGQHPHTLVRQSCAKALMQIADPDGVPALVQAFLQDLEVEVRGAAIGALAHLGADAVAPLLEILTDPALPEVTHGQARWALATAGVEASDLIYAHINSEAPVVRAAVVGAIATILQAQPNPAAIAPLLTALQDPEVTVCCAAVGALSRIKHLAAIAPFTQILAQNPHPEARQAAALGLIAAGGPRRSAPPPPAATGRNHR